MRQWYTPPGWADLPAPGRQARQSLAGGTKIDRQTATTANTAIRERKAANIRSKINSRVIVK
mgnify:CR=1 FL=1